MDGVRNLVPASGISVVLAQDRDRFAREPRPTITCSAGSSASTNSASRGNHLRPLKPPQPFCRVRRVGLRYASCALVHLDKFT
jgi:hypothetical protein